MTFPISRRLIILTALLAVPLLFSAVHGVRGIAETNRRLQVGLHDSRILVRAVDTARLAEVHLKAQVQEWKDVLLRGRDAEAFQQHWAAFQEKERLVREDLGVLKSLMQELALPLNGVDALQALHQSMGVQYREALVRYDRAAPEAGRAVDRLVEGLDREAVERLEALVASVRQVVHSRLLEREKEAGERFKDDLSQAQGLVVVLVIFIGLALWLAHGILRELKSGDIND